MNPFRKIANCFINCWIGETAPEVSDSTELTGGVMTLNSPSFLESMGLSRRRKTTSEVTYFTCLKMLSETLAKMPIKYYHCFYFIKVDMMLENMYPLRNKSMTQRIFTTRHCRSHL